MPQLDPDLSLLVPSNGWFSVTVDRGWPPTWERTHCGSCDAPWFDVEHRTDGIYACVRPSRTAHAYAVRAGPYVTVADALTYLSLNFDRQMCRHADPVHAD